MTTNQTIIGAEQHKSYFDNAKRNRELIAHVGNDWTGRDGVRHFSFQLLENGKAVATIDFTGNNYERFNALDWIDEEMLITRAREAMGTHQTFSIEQN